jgi:integrase
MTLTDMKCKQLKPREKSYKVADANGLYLEVMPNGSKYWRMRYYYADREKRLAFGVYPTVTLSEARNKKEEAKKTLALGLDPGQLKKEAKQKAKISHENSFEIIARGWHENRKHIWSKKYAQDMLTKLEDSLLPSLGQRPINEIKPLELLSCIRSIEQRGAIDLAHRLLQICGQIFRYAVLLEKAERDISADIRGALKPKPKVKHYSCVEEAELPEMLKKIENYVPCFKGHIQTQLALKFLFLTFVRTTELRAAKWEEINIESAEWRIPEARMKMNEKHIVPLSRQAIEVLNTLQVLNGHSPFIFPNLANPQKCMSENTVLYAFYRMGYHSRATGHGVRATASTILNEKGFSPDVIERQLAHCERNKIRAAYNHAEYLKERKDMMQFWADYLDEARQR